MTVENKTHIFFLKNWMSNFQQCNTLIDQIWSCGLAENDPLILDPKNWTGQNLLGKVLMEVRDLIK